MDRSYRKIAAAKDRSSTPESPMPSVNELQSMLRGLRDGSLSVDEVAERLIGEVRIGEVRIGEVRIGEQASSGSGATDRHPTLTLDQMLRHHGPPPAVIVDRWTEQLRHRIDNGQPLPVDPADWTVWSIDSDGSLRCDAEPIGAAEAIPFDRWLDQFRRSIRSRQMAEPTADHATSNALPVDKPIDAPERPRANAKVQPRAAAAVLIVAVIAGLTWWALSASTPNLVATSSETAAKSTGSTEPPPTVSHPMDNVDEVDLQTFDRPADIFSPTPIDQPVVETATIKFETPSLQTDLASDSPSTIEAAPADNAAMDAMLQGIAPEPEISPPGDDTPAVDLQTLGDDDGPAATVQKIATGNGGGSAMAVSLPPARDAETSVPLGEMVAGDAELTLQFPSPPKDDLSLSRDDAGWSIRLGQTPLATLSGSSLSGSTLSGSTLSFAWTDRAAKQKTATDKIRTGRLIVGGDPVYLRPVVRGDPYRFRFDDPDTRPTWMLGLPPDRMKSQLDLSLVLPSGFDYSWIEPLDVISVRGGRAIAVITDQAESAAIGLRMDVRVDRRLSIRLRFAGRLADHLPWSMLSHSHVDVATAAWTRFAAAVSRESVRLKRVDEVAYDIGGRKGKRIIAEKIRVNDARAEDAATALTRLAELKTMMLIMEKQAMVTAKITTRWDGEVQTILDAVGD